MIHDGVLSTNLGDTGERRGLWISHGLELARPSIESQEVSTSCHRRVHTMTPSSLMRTPRTPCSRLDQEDAALTPPLAKPAAILQAVLIPSELPTMQNHINLPKALLRYLCVSQLILNDYLSTLSSSQCNLHPSYSVTFPKLNFKI
jgi:hypothetical protein